MEFIDERHNKLTTAAPELLISVKDKDEAVLVGQSDAIDILDVKDPDKGSLGRPDAAILRSILDHSTAKQRISVAIGEAKQIDFSIAGYLNSCDRYRKLSFVKFGLATLADNPDWRERIKELVNEVPNYATPVLCGYVDFINAHSPEPIHVLQLVADLGLRNFLLDTYQKSGESFFDYFESSNFAECSRLARQLNIKLGIAGSIRISFLNRVRQLAPDIVAVRGAACRSQARSNEITSDSLQKFTTAFKLECC